MYQGSNALAILRWSGLVLASILLIACSSSDDNAGVVPDGGSGTVDPSENLNGNPNEADGQTTAGGNAEPPAVEACSVPDINRWVYATMKKDYLFNKQMPDVNPDGFFTSQRLLDRLTVLQDDATRLYDTPGSGGNPVPAGASLSYGFRYLGLTADNYPQLKWLNFNSPARAAGLQRGDVILSINGTPGDQLTANRWALWEKFLYEDDATVIPELTVRSGNEAPRTLKLQRAQFELQALDSVRHAYVQTGMMRQVALLSIEHFRRNADLPLDSFARWYTQQGAVDLILDLRYSRGGRVNQAKKLASQIAGNGAAGRPYLLYDYNPDFEDEVLFLTNQENTLGLQRVIALTSAETTYSSSYLLAALKNYVEVITIGEATEALTDSFIVFDYKYCGKTLQLTTANQLGPNRESLLAPIQPTCPVTDNWDQPTTDSRDPLLNAGLYYAFNNNCPVARTISPTVTESVNSAAPVFASPGSAPGMRDR